MQEKELRLAVVCSGGISLAVYMHGVVKEILKLARASKLYHAVPDASRKRERSFEDIPIEDGRVFDTEAVYFDLLHQIGGTLDLRVIVDVIAGASAGGINSVLLARALAHDLAFDDLRELWLTGADVNALVAEDRKPGWSDRMVRPLVRWIAGERLDMEMDEEVAEKLTMMAQVTRLRPPFDGERLIASLITAMEVMGKPRHSTDSLIPAGLRLDMYVTLTDFFGYVREIPLYDPPIIEEREHRHRLHFRYRRWPDGQVESDFDTGCIPALAFAARATASFPAAFPPAQLAEVDRVLARRGEKWTAKERFLNGNFRPYRKAGMDPEKTSFIDGSVLNNKPFAPAIEAIGRQPAYRRVDRRLVYINPNPADSPPPPSGKPPGLLRTLKAALSDIPRNEPIADDLGWVQQLNERTRRVQEIVEAARSDIAVAVDKLTKGKLDMRHVSAQQISDWRSLANASAAEQAGFAYKGYLRIKLHESVDQIGRLVGQLCEVEPGSPRAGFIEEAMRAWATERGVLPAADWQPEAGTLTRDPPVWIRMLRSFDLEFRARRMRFVIRALNRLYGTLSQAGTEDFSAWRLDYLKGRCYEVLDALRGRDGTAAISLEAASRTRDVFAPALAKERFDPMGGAAFGLANLDSIGTIVTGIARDIDLEAMNRRSDEIFSSMEHAGTAGRIRRELLVHYLGFSFWDMVTFSAGLWESEGNYNEIRVARLSPQDCNAIRKGGPDEVLKGVKLGNFGAFFKRAHRENDYLWGRLHGVDRLVDILLDAARVEGAGGDVDVAAAKKRAFRIVLDEECRHLSESDALLDQLAGEIDRL
ncbi:MAG: patatin-like protein [Alphaproteobacteria bacterium]|nr:patatin-like protein [Alphaproteobacteria bacterium]